MRQDILDELGLIYYQRRPRPMISLWIIGDQTMLQDQDACDLFHAILDAVGLSATDVRWGSMMELQRRILSMDVKGIWTMMPEFLPSDRPMIQSPPLLALLNDPKAKKQLYGALVTLCSVI